MKTKKRRKAVKHRTIKRRVVKRRVVQRKAVSLRWTPVRRTSSGGTGEIRYRAWLVHNGRRVASVTSGADSSLASLRSLPWFRVDVRGKYVGTIRLKPRKGASMRSSHLAEASGWKKAGAMAVKAYRARAR